MEDKSKVTITAKLEKIPCTTLPVIDEQATDVRELIDKSAQDEYTFRPDSFRNY